MCLCLSVFREGRRRCIESGVSSCSGWQDEVSLCRATSEQSARSSRGAPGLSARANTQGPGSFCAAVLAAADFLFDQMEIKTLKHVTARPIAAAPSAMNTA